MGVSEVGPVRGIVADLSKLVVLQGVEPEGDIADVASGVEVCEREDGALGLPVVPLEGGQPHVPAATHKPRSILLLDAISEQPTLIISLSGPVTHDHFMPVALLIIMMG